MVINIHTPKLAQTKGSQYKIKKSTNTKLDTNAPILLTYYKLILHFISLHFSILQSLLLESIKIKEVIV